MNKHIHAQFYNHSPNDTIKANAIWEDGNVYNIKQINSSVDTLYFKWIVVSVSLPIGWEASICDNKNCFGELKDSSEMDLVVPNDFGLMSLHIKPLINSGIAMIRYKIFNKKTPSKIDTLTWIISSNKSVAIIQKQEDGLKIFIHNKMLKIAEPQNVASIDIIDLSGRLIHHFSTWNQEVELSNLRLSNGKYIIAIKLKNDGYKNLVFSNE